MTKKKAATKLTALDPKLDPNVIYARGYITKAEADSGNLDKLARKVRLSNAGKDVEGIWAAFLSKEDLEAYDNNHSRGDRVRCILLNHALNFMPNPSWGRVIEGKTRGGERPEFLRDDQIELFKRTHEAYMKEYPREQEADA